MFYQIELGRHLLVNTSNVVKIGIVVVSWTIISEIPKLLPVGLFCRVVYNFLSTFGIPGSRLFKYT